MKTELTLIQQHRVRKAVKHGATAGELRVWTGLSYAELKRQMPDLPKTPATSSGELDFIKPND